MMSGILAVVLPRLMRCICFYINVLFHMDSVPSLFFYGFFLPWVSEEMKLCPFHSVLNTFSTSGLTSAVF